MNAFLYELMQTFLVFSFYCGLIAWWLRFQRPARISFHGLTAGGLRGADRSKRKTGGAQGPKGTHTGRKISTPVTFTPTI